MGGLYDLICGNRRWKIGKHKGPQFSILDYPSSIDVNGGDL
jgi:hypothetical protein